MHEERQDCIINGCCREATTRKLCKTHYDYLRKHRVFKKFDNLSDEAIIEIYYEYCKSDTTYKGML